MSREEIDKLDQEIADLTNAIEKMDPDAMLDGANWRDQLIQARQRRIEERAVWKYRQRNWTATEA
ncbi:hypothetical protein [Brevundimonas sp.]|uniref:hypothetical protein n=1 Tax=Brevundimonas sp. TaxID=1871086 RepID=UPI002896D3BB|nr:hypothetical protein [Brevundimonas sp.]